MAATKININLKNGYSKIGWIIINVIWLFSAPTLKHGIWQKLW